MKELVAKIREALVSTLPITLIVYLVALLPVFSFSRLELITFTIGAVMLVEITEEGMLLKEKAVSIPEKITGCVNLSTEDAIQLYQLLYKILGTLTEE